MDGAVRYVSETLTRRAPNTRVRGRLAGRASVTVLLQGRYPYTVASRLAMEGIDLVAMRELMGHKTMAMTLRYSHLSPGHRRAAIERLVTRATTVDPQASSGAE